MRKILLAILFCATVLSAYTQSKLSPFSRIEMAKRSNPATPEGKRSMALRGAGETEYVTAFVSYDDPDALTQLANGGAVVGMAQDGIATVRLPVDRAEELSALEGIVRIEFAKPVYPSMDKARVEGAVDGIHQGVGLDLPYTGKGVVVGIIDGGIEYAHPNFFTADKKELRVKRVWNQLDHTGKPVEGMITPGSEYTTPEEIMAHVRDRDDESHGTHVAGIAAGADNRFGMRGVAPDADIVFVATTMDDVATSEGIKYIFDYAQSVGKPCVINMSFGTFIGPHDGTSVFDQRMESLVGEGRVFVVSAGNWGSDPVHVSKRFTSPADTLRTFVKMNDMPSSPAAVGMYGAKERDYQVWYTVVDTETGETIFSTDTIRALDQNMFNYATFTGGEGSILFASGKDLLNGKGNVQFQGFVTSWDKPTYQFVLNATSAQNELHAWTNDRFSLFQSRNVAGFTDGDSDYTIGEGGPSGNRTVTVGSYTTKNKYYSLKRQKTVETKDPIANISYFSSKGPRADGAVKPNITTPGCYLVSSFSSAVWDHPAYGNLITHKHEKAGKTYYWGAVQGTSMASPFAAGVVGLWLQANPKLTPEDVMDIMRQTATRDEFTGIIPSGGSNTWGHGKLNAMEGLKEAIRRNPTGITSVRQEETPLFLLTQNAGSVDIFFTRDMNDAVIEVFDSSGGLISRQQLPRATKAQTTRVQLSRKGVYILSVKSDNGTQTQKIMVNG